MTKKPAEKGRDEEAVVVVEQPATVVQPQQYPQPVDHQGNVITNNGQPFSQELLAIYNSKDNVKTLDTLAAEEAARQAAAQNGQQPVAVVQQPQTDQQQPAYQPLEQWGSGKSFAEIAKGSQHSLGSLIADYNKWAKTNNQDPLDFWEYAQLFQKYDASKSIKDQEAEEKRQRNKEMWGDVGHLLIGLGNFAGAIGGAPEPGKDAKAHVEKLTASQRLRREKAKEERKAYNKFLLEQMFKQKAEERALEKQKREAELIAARIHAIQEDDRRKENEDRRKEEKNKSEIEKNKSVINVNNEKAKHPYTRRVSSGRAGKPKDTTYEELENNIEKYPEEAKKFKGSDDYTNKNRWTTGQARMFNQRIKNKEASKQNAASTKTANDYSKYKVKK